MYSADNIAVMREYIAILIDPLRESWDASFFKDHSSMIEDRLRTYIRAKISVQDLGEEVRKVLVIKCAARGVSYDGDGRVIKNAPSDR
jgi:hypothetical protein